MGIKSAIGDFKNGLSIIFSKPDVSKGGNRKMAKLALIIQGQIPMYGKHAVRTQLIKSIEGDFRRAARKGGKKEIDRMIEEALATPEYVELLRKVGLDESHVRVMAMAALKKVDVK